MRFKPQPEIRADLLNSIRAMGTADTHDLADDTGRTLKAIRQQLPIMESAGMIRRVGRTPGTLRIRWESR